MAEKKRFGGGGGRGGRGGGGRGSITSFFAKSSSSSSFGLEDMSFKDERFVLATKVDRSVFPSTMADRFNVRMGLELADAAYKAGDVGGAQEISDACGASKVKYLPPPPPHLKHTPERAPFREEHSLALSTLVYILRTRGIDDYLTILLSLCLSRFCLTLFLSPRKGGPRHGGR